MDHCEKQNRTINPREKANFFSKYTFGYTIGLFRKGLKKDLEESDLYEVVKSCKSQKCGDKIEKQWKKSPSICKLLWERFSSQYIIVCLVTIFWTELHSVLQPYGLSRLISYFEANQTKISKTEAYKCAGIVVFLSVFHFLYFQNLHVYQMTVGLKIKASLKSLLYRKALKLSPSALSETSLGNLVTIITKDIHSMEHNLWLVMDLIIYIIQTLTVAYLLYAKLGVSAFIGLGFIFISLPIQMYLSSLLTKMRLKTAKNTDARLQITQEALSGIKIIKMYTWEDYFIRKIAEYRNKEIIVMMRVYFLNVILISIGIITSKVTFLLLMLAYIWMGYTTSTELIFYVLGLFHQLTTSVGVMIPISMSRAAQFYASFIRLNKILQADELRKIDNAYNEKPSIEMKGTKVKIGDREILKDISLQIKNPSLVVVTGVVGAGKSSLLKAVLQDYPISEGIVEVGGSISYASQEPWLFPSSIKQNILFGEEYDKSRYEEVVRVCALEYDLSQLEDRDETLVADRGQNLSKGQQCRVNLARAVYRNSDIYLFDDSLTSLDGHVQDFIFTECIKKYLKDKICVLVSQNFKHVEQADQVVVLQEGSITFAGKPEDVINQDSNSFVVNKNKDNDTKNDIGKECNTKPSLLQTEQQHSKINVYHEVKKIGKVDISVYVKYFKFGGGFIAFGFVALLYIVAQVCESSSDKLLTKWVDLQQTVLDMTDNSTINGTYYNETLTSKNNTFNMYTILTLLQSAMSLVKFYALIRFCRSASINIHEAMSSTIVNAVMSFFDTHFIGNILNRFSLDLHGIDERLPFVFPGLISVVFSCSGSIILISTVNWLFLIPSFIFVCVLILMRMGYIPTGRSLKRLEAATRSPLVGHINSSLEGLTTIRAFKAEQILKDEFDRHQDLNSSAFFTWRLSSFGFGFFMDLFSTIFTILVISRFLFFEHDVSAGNVGLALTQVFMLTRLVQWGVREWAELENHMTSVERTLEYTEVQSETKSGDCVKNWPSHGSIKFENVIMTYDSNKAPVLKNINFSIKPNQKIGVVGRTGAGKSSIISALFRLYEFEGNIEIDGVDIKKLYLTFLRKNIAIIPQDPILFTGTIRDNIDPYKHYPDNKIWQTIEKVKLKSIIPSLDLAIQENDSTFSSGQKQLICLARAALRGCKIVVLDEATSNMDTTTDKLLYSIIEEIFANCTLFIIAHRMHSVVKCDLVLVMDSGELVECGHPSQLLDDENSMFHKMCRETKLD